MTETPFAPMLLTEIFDTVEASRAWMDMPRINWNGTPEYPYVTRSSANNGIAAIVPHQGIAPNPGNTITVGVDTQTVLYQPVDYYAGVKVQALRAKRLTEASAMVLVAALRLQMPKFAWGNGASLARLKRSQVLVPVTSHGRCDWDEMERIGANLLTLSREAAAAAIDPFAATDGLATPPALTYAPRLIPEVFDSVQSSRAAMDAIRIHRQGTLEYAYVTRTGTNNGIADIIPRQSVEPNPGNVITVGLDTQTAAYQPRPFYTGQNVHVLGSPHLDRDAAIVLVSLVRQQLAKFSWGGNGATLGRLRRTQMMVPIVENGSVDWNGLRRAGQHLLRQAALRAQGEHSPVATSSS